MLVPIALTVMAGAAMLKSGEEPESLWTPLSAVFMSLSALTLGGSGLFAVAAMDKVLKERAEEVDAIPDDEEVLAYETELLAKQASRREALSWEGLSTAWRGVLITSVLLVDVSAWIFQASSECFHDVVLTTDVSAPPLSGNVFNVVRPHGWVGVGCQGAGWLCYGVFSLHISRKIKAASQAVVPL